MTACFMTDKAETCKRPSFAAQRAKSVDALFVLASEERSLHFHAIREDFVDGFKVHVGVLTTSYTAPHHVLRVTCNV